MSSGEEEKVESNEEGEKGVSAEKEKSGEVSGERRVRVVESRGDFGGGGEEKWRRLGCYSAHGGMLGPDGRGKWEEEGLEAAVWKRKVRYSI